MTKGELDELNHDGRVYSGSYLSEDEWSHYQSDNYPSDDNALCYVMTEALTGVIQVMLMAPISCT